MKFFTTLSLSLLSLNVLAAPIITEGNRIFHDSKNIQKIYHVPDQLNLKIEDGKPDFGFYKLHNTENQPEKGIIMALFDISTSEELKSDIDFLLFQDFYLARLPVAETTFKIKDEIKPLVMNSNIFADDIKRSFVSYISDVTEEGIKTLPDMLKTNPRNVTLFSLCYEVEGVSPSLKGSFAYNLQTISNHILTLPRTEATFDELRDSVEYLVRTHKIVMRYQGEGSYLDYVASFTRALIQMMFIKKFDQDVYTLDTDRIVDVMDTYSVDGAEYIKKEFCIKANLKALETATEKLN